MLMNLHKKSWTYGLKLQRFEDHHKANETTIEVRMSSRRDEEKRVWRRRRDISICFFSFVGL